MRRAVRWTVSAIVIVHGLIHLLGVAKGFGWAEVPELTEPISTAMALVWLIAAGLVVAAGVLLASGVRWWWTIGLVGAVVSQAVIVTSWSDAKAGTAANVLLLLAALHGVAAEGPRSFRGRYRNQARAALALAGRSAAPGPPLVTTEDLGHLPPLVAGYIASSGSIGQPRIGAFRARIHGRIRAGAEEPWMTWTGEQVNTFGPHPTRLFLMDATMRGLPADVLHTYVGSSARMRARVCSVVKVLDATGPDMTRAETVTLLNDLCVLAPAALVDAPITWTPVDDHRVRASFTNAGHTVGAELVFDDAGDLVDFVSDDRLRASADGTTFTRQRWSTPLAGYRSFGPRRISVVGRGRWHPEGSEPPFDYLEFHVDDITYVEPHAARAASAAVNVA
jgi:hypothetical protein